MPRLRLEKNREQKDDADLSAPGASKARSARLAAYADADEREPS